MTAREPAQASAASVAVEQPVEAIVARMRDILGRRRWWFLVVTALVFAGAIVFVRHQQPIFRATGTLQIDNTPPKVLGEMSEVYSLGTQGAYGGVKQYYRAQQSILQSRDLAAMVVSRLALSHDERFFGFQYNEKPLTKAQKESIMANADAVGLTLVELGEARHKPPLEAALDLLLEEENAVGMIDVYGSEDHIKAFIRRPEMNLCTDGLLGGRPHPRVYGSFPKLLRYVREENLVTLEEAVRKMTGQPAAVFGFDDRGTLTIGKAADLVLFDPATVGDTGTYADPARFPEGIASVFVAGKTVWDGHSLSTAGFPGQVLRRRP